MNLTGVLSYSGGIPTSKINTGQQWDFPNGWPPLNHMIIEGFRKSSNPFMQEAGYQLAAKWVAGNYKVYAATGHMYEKYDVRLGNIKPGGGGEYVVQTGFGWTNGVILDLLYIYGDRMLLTSSATRLISSYFLSFILSSYIVRHGYFANFD